MFVGINGDQMEIVAHGKTREEVIANANIHPPVLEVYPASADIYATLEAGETIPSLQWVLVTPQDGEKFMKFR